MKRQHRHSYAGNPSHHHFPSSSTRSFDDAAAASKWRRRSTEDRRAPLPIPEEKPRPDDTGSHLYDFLEKNRARCLPRPLTPWERKLPDNRRPTNKERLRDRCTHLLSNGVYEGVVSVPPDLFYSFLEAYGRDIDQGYLLFVNEERSHPQTVEYIDFDLVRESPMTNEQIVKLAQWIHPLIADFFDFPPDWRPPGGSALNHPLTMLIFTRPAQYLPEDKQLVPINPARHGPGCWKIGIHFIFPAFHLTAEEALYVRQRVLAKMISDLPERPYAKNSWSEAFDTLVYLENGLRCAGSAKMVKCPNFKQCSVPQAVPVHCQACDDQRRVVDDAVYSLIEVLDADGQPDVALSSLLKSTPMAQTMQHYCIRVPQRHLIPTVGFRIPERFRQIFAPPEDVLKTCRRIAQERSQSHKYIPPMTHQDCVDLGLNPSSSGAKKSNGATSKTPLGKVYHNYEKKTSCLVPLNCMRTEILQQLIRQWMPEYAHAQITRLSCDEEVSTYLVCVDGTHHCQRVRYEHSSSPIYFVLTIKGLVQRCTSWRGTPTQDGTLVPERPCVEIEAQAGVGGCKKFASPPNRHVLTPINMLLFFGISKQELTRRAVESCVGSLHYQMFEVAFVEPDLPLPNDTEVLDDQSSCSSSSLPPLIILPPQRSASTLWSVEDYRGLMQLLAPPPPPPSPPFLPSPSESTINPPPKSESPTPLLPLISSSEHSCDGEPSGSSSHPSTALSLSIDLDLPADGPFPPPSSSSFLGGTAPCKSDSAVDSDTDEYPVSFPT